ncbi:MAG TPA: carboxypeptidase-like regulatory domain-containing protein, partial [Pirellulales bacterium]|nr:carboxypeptidase-like regulatory domain-containing protein [Pirellulales bacterium]
MTRRGPDRRGLAHYCVVLAVLCTLAATGCSRKHIPPWGTAAGTASIAGQPIAEGTVVFENPELGVARMAELAPDGSFVQKSVDFPGLPVGKYRVAVLPTRISKGDWVPVARSKPKAGAATIREKYHSVSTSGLTAEVKEGQNPPLTFDLEK